MKLEIELKDEFCYEDNLDNALSKLVVNALYRKLKEDVLAKLEEKWTEQVTERISAALDPMVTAHVEELIASGMVQPRGAKEPVTIEEHIQKMFTDNRGYSSPQSHIETRAKQFADDMKKRYDNLFAMQIVKNMKEQGLLVENFEKLLEVQPAKH